MKLKLAPSLLLSVLHIAPSAAFAPSPHTSLTRSSSLHSYNSNEYYSQECNEDEYSNANSQHPIYNEQNVDFSRRDTTGAFFRGLTAAGAVAAGSAVMRPWSANAAEFSDGGIPAKSSAAAAPAVSSPPPQAQQELTISNKSLSPSLPSFTKLKTPTRSTSAATAIEYKNSLAEMDTFTLSAGAIATAGLLGVAGTSMSSQENNWASNEDTKPATATAAATDTKEKKEEPKSQPWYQPPTPYGLLNKNTNPFTEKAATATTVPPGTIAGPPPPLGAAPYGLAGGRNYWDNKDLGTAMKLSTPPKEKVVPPPPPDVDVATLNNNEDRPWYQPPTPYGLINKSKNPFLKDIQQYCEPGKVSDPCTESIKGYLNDLSKTGEAASGEAAGTIVGYLDSLGDGKAPKAEVVKEALATGSSPSQTSAKVVKEYLDALDIGKKPIATGMVMKPPKHVASDTNTSRAPWEAYNVRLSNIETRVESLEQRVESLPDEVFNRMEEWRLEQENKWSGQMNDVSSSAGGAGSGYVVPSPPSPPKKMRVNVMNAPRSTGMGGYLESLNP